MVATATPPPQPDRLRLKAAAGRLLASLLRDGRGYLNAADADALDLIPECHQVRVWPRNRDVIGVDLINRTRKGAA